MDFLAENNHCGQTLLKLVARANSSIAEVLRLKDVIPGIYRAPSRLELLKYGELITCDFTYFKTAEYFEQKVDSSEALQDADEELKETYLPILTRLYRAFESIYRFAIDFNHYLQDLEDGNFIQQTVESVFMDEDGKQLLCEALYLYGVMLLLVDLHIEGSVRERIMVAYFRYSGQHSNESNVDDVCKLLRSTGFSATPKRPPNYPEQYFGRVSFPNTFVRMVIGKIRSDDIYNQHSCYPNPEHRSTAFSEQAAMLFVSLYFAPSILKNETAAMREIVDKFFPDNWVISVYMGTTVNLIEAWEPYKAAKAALANTTQATNVREIALKHAKQLKVLLPQTQRLLKEGALVEENILDNVVKVLKVVRDCNVTLRWIMLHTSALGQAAEMNKKCRQLRDQVLADIQHQPLLLFQLLLNTGQFQSKLMTMYRKMLNGKEKKWNHLRQECQDRMTELADVFGGNQALSRVQKSERLQKWFLDREKQIASLELVDPQSAGRLAIQLIDALTEAQDFHQLEANLQVKQHLIDTKGFLNQMIRVAGIKEDVLIQLQIIADLSYAWEIVDSFTPFMQDGVKRNPSLIGQLRATFLKLSSALERPVLRISQANSKDLASVSQYYSNELVGYVRRVLQIVPESMFGLLDRIIRLQISHIKEVPTRLDKDKLRDYAQLNERHEIAKLTHEISVFTEGMLAMKSTLVGVIKVDPKQLLEDGIRKELVRQVTTSFHNALTFNPKAKTSELPEKLAVLDKIMAGFKRSFEYIQDYVNISGLKIWQEELSRIINFTVEQEANLFLKQKVTEYDSIYQSRSIPIPVFPSSDPNTLTFIGRLANELTVITNPKTTVFVKAMQAWYDNRTFQETASLDLFGALERAVGTFGLAGLDRLLGLKAVTCLQNIISLLDRTVFHDKNWIDLLENLFNSLNPVENVIAQPAKLYQQHISRSSKALASFMDAMVTLGQLQILRKMLGFQLALSSNFDSKILNSALKTFNQAVVQDLVGKDELPRESMLLYELSTFLQWSGITDPSLQVYVMAKPAPKLAELTFLGVIANLGRFAYSSNAGGLMATRKAPDQADGYPFLVGVACFLQQYPDQVAGGVIDYLSQYDRSFSESNCSSPETVNAAIFLEGLVDERKVSRKTLFGQVPPPILEFNRMGMQS